MQGVGGEYLVIDVKVRKERSCYEGAKRKSVLRRE